MGGIVSGFGTAVLGGMAASDEARQGNIRAGQARQINDYKAAVSNANAGIATGQVRTKGSELAAQQGTAYAASGIDQSMGTAAAVQADTAAMSEVDAQTIRNNAAREAWGYAVDTQQEAEKAKAGRDAAGRKAVGSVLTGFGQAAGSGAALS